MNAALPEEFGLLLVAALFVIGLAGVLVRRNLIFIVLSLEVMLNAAGLAFVVGGTRWREPDGQIMFIFILTVAAAEVAVALALLLWFHRRYKDLGVEAANKLRG